MTAEVLAQADQELILPESGKTGLMRRESSDLAIK
jgi:hypothetical protein